MDCPICKNIELKSIILHNVEIDYCPRCLGLWFDQEELRWAKDEKDDNLQWLDIDLWQDEKKFKITNKIKPCPVCRLPLYEVEYGDSGIKVDICNVCHGVWLDRGEFKHIIEWLKKKAHYEVLNNYSKNVFQQFKEVLSSPRDLSEEMVDFLIVLKLINYKLAIKYPNLSKLLSNIPR